MFSGTATLGCHCFYLKKLILAQKPVSYKKTACIGVHLLSKGGGCNGCKPNKVGGVLSMQTTCKLEGGGGRKSGNFANVIYECPRFFFSLIDALTYIPHHCLHLFR